MELLNEPFPWHVSGFLISLIMLLLILMGKSFGVSSNLRTICAALGAGKTCDFFCFNWKTTRWNLFVIFGALIGGFIAANYMSGLNPPDINPDVIAELNTLGFESAGNNYLPLELFDNLYSIKAICILLIGGILIGFGARYAGGCTSGHAISGLSNLQLPSLIAVLGFFIGGLLMIHLIFPFIF
ncbi:MAG: YeeE/YedE family protein [Flavobacteriaceae bacterium]|nr:YeeE/YedE family protein [Flavobacteriaceae bacterium]